MRLPVQFVLGPSSTNYTLALGSFTDTGSIGNNMAECNGRPFGTLDRDTDNYAAGNCAVEFQGQLASSQALALGRLPKPRGPLIF